MTPVPPPTRPGPAGRAGGSPIRAAAARTGTAPGTAELTASARPDGLMDAARAIMTTDTFPKVATARVKIGDAEVVINGIAKGAGMIAPDMATMLAFVFTDAAIAAPALQGLLA